MNNQNILEKVKGILENKNIDVLDKTFIEYIIKK